jgi:hypothetical protein
VTSAASMEKGQNCIPPEYHALKCVAHSMLALFAHLSHEPGKPLGEERVTTLKEYREFLAAAGPAAELRPSPIPFRTSRICSMCSWPGANC